MQIVYNTYAVYVISHYLADSHANLQMREMLSPLHRKMAADHIISIAEAHFSENVCLRAMDGGEILAGFIRMRCGWDYEWRSLRQRWMAKSASDLSPPSWKIKREAARLPPVDPGVCVA